MIEFKKPAFLYNLTENHIRISIGLAGFALGYAAHYIIERNKKGGEEPSVIELEEQGLVNYEQLVQRYIEEPSTGDEEHPIFAEHNNDEPALITIMSNDDNDWDYSQEELNRSTERPYILNVDEFHVNEKNYSQMTLTYYEGDDILVDEDETPIYNHISVTGPLLFGHGSRDPNVVYIRNDRLKAEYEVLYDSESYSDVILGLHVEPTEKIRKAKHKEHE